MKLLGTLCICLFSAVAIAAGATTIQLPSTDEAGQTSFQMVGTQELLRTVWVLAIDGAVPSEKTVVIPVAFESKDTCEAGANDLTKIIKETLNGKRGKRHWTCGPVILNQQTLP